MPTRKSSKKYLASACAPAMPASPRPVSCHCALQQSHHSAGIGGRQRAPAVARIALRPSRPRAWARNPHVPFQQAGVRVEIPVTTTRAAPGLTAAAASSAFAEPRSRCRLARISIASRSVAAEVVVHTIKINQGRVVATPHNPRLVITAVRRRVIVISSDYSSIGCQLFPRWTISLVHAEKAKTKVFNVQFSPILTLIISNYSVHFIM